MSTMSTMSTMATMPTHAEQLGVVLRKKYSTTDDDKNSQMIRDSLQQVIKRLSKSPRKSYLKNKVKSFFSKLDSKKNCDSTMVELDQCNKCLNYLLFEINPEISFAEMHRLGCERFDEVAVNVVMDEYFGHIVNYQNMRSKNTSNRYSITNSITKSKSTSKSTSASKSKSTSASKSKSNSNSGSDARLESLTQKSNTNTYDANIRLERKIKQKYGMCVISGRNVRECCVTKIVNEPTITVQENNICLSYDIKKLFEMHMITIDSKSLKLKVSSDIINYKKIKGGKEMNGIRKLYKKLAKKHNKYIRYKGEFDIITLSLLKYHNKHFSKREKSIAKREKCTT